MADRCPRAVPEPAPPPRLVHAIGRIVVNGARLELDVVVIVWSALGHARPVRSSRSGKVKTPSDAFEQSLSDLRSIAQQRFDQPLRGQVLDCADHAARVVQHRHLAAHGTWLAIPDDDGRHQVTRLRGTKDAPVLIERFSIDEVDAMATEIHEARGMLVSLLGQMVIALPEARATVQELPPDFDEALRPGVAGEPPTSVEGMSTSSFDGAR